jgi:hypothetical protein
MFRIQNEDVIGKARAKANAKPKEKGLASSSVTAGDEVDETTVEKAVLEFSRHVENPGYWALSLIPPSRMASDIDDRARCFFKANAGNWGRNFDLVETLVSQTHGDEHLLASLTAAGLASLSNSVNSPQLMIQARRRYVSALRLTNAALRSPTEAKKDSTLFAVMILGIFETVAGSNEQSLLAWTEHMNGAAALLKLRGVSQLSTEAGQRIFYQVTSNLMITCIQRIIPMPAHVIEIRKQAEKVMDTSHPAWVLSSIIIDFTVFRAAVHDRRIVGTRAVIDGALALDQRFIDIFSDVPPEWRYVVKHTDEMPHLVWNKTYHVYSYAWVVQLWNGMRTCRILLHQIIRRHLSSDALATVPEFTYEEAVAQMASSVSITLQLQQDILSSISHQSIAFQNPNDPSSTLSGSRNSFIIHPLYLIGALDLSSEEIKDWVVARLRLLHDSAGIRQAGVLAGYLSRRQEFWDQALALRTLRRAPEQVRG